MSRLIFVDTDDNEEYGRRDYPVVPSKGDVFVLEGDLNVEVVRPWHTGKTERRDESDRTQLWVIEVECRIY